MADSLINIYVALCNEGRECLMKFCDDCTRKCKQVGKAIYCRGKHYLKHRQPLTLAEAMLTNINSFNHPALKMVRVEEVK